VGFLLSALPGCQGKHRYFKEQEAFQKPALLSSRITIKLFLDIYRSFCANQRANSSAKYYSWD